MDSIPNHMGKTAEMTRQMNNLFEDASVEAVKYSLGLTTLDEAIIENILAKKNLSGAALETAVSEVTATQAANGLTISETAATGATNGLSLAVKGLGVQLKALVVKHPTVATIAAATIAIGGISAAILKVMDIATTSHKKLREQADNAREISANSASEAEKLQNELTTNEEKIKSLKSQGALTVIEQNQLDKLTEANNNLRVQYELKKKIMGYGCNNSFYHSKNCR